MHRLIRPLTARATYRRWAHLVLGGALLMPYVLLVSTGFTVREGQPMVYPPFAPIGMSLAIVGLCVPLLG